jgi:putative heme-binding domain-containing protein
LRQLRGLNHSDVNAQLSRIWPQTEEGGSKAQLFAKYKALLTDENLAKADLSRGRAVYAQSCGVCHKLYGEGADIGPELTGSDRKNLDYLLDNIVNPSGVVPEAYRVSLVNMRDDQVLTGILTAQSGQSITVQTVSDRLTLPRQDVDSIQESALSMMPDGILESLSEQQILDLVAYLRSSNPVPAPESAGGK